MKTQITRSTRHALLLDNTTLLSLEATLRRNYEQVRVGTKNTDGTQLEAGTVNELLTFANPTYRSICNVTYSASSPSTNDILSLSEGATVSVGGSQAETAAFSLHSIDDQKAVALASEFEKHLREARPWYSFLTRFHPTPILGLVIAIPFLIISFLMFFGALQLPESTQPSNPWWVLLYTNLAAGIALAALGEALARVQRWLFPRTFFLIGRQQERYARITSMRRWVFGGTLFAILIGVVANLVTRLI